MNTSVRNPGVPEAEVTPEELEAVFSARAGGVDGGDVDLREGLSYLGARGLIGHRDPLVQSDVLREVSASCMASAFSLWAQVMVVRYLEHPGSEFLADLSGELRQATLAGSTAMAGAFQDADGFRELETRYLREGSDVVITGSVRWASNLFEDGFVMVLAARGEDGSRIVVAVPSGTPGLEVRPARDLLALGSTASGSVYLDEVRVGPEWIVSVRFEEFVESVRPEFLAYQCAFCLGLADASLSVSADRLGHSYDGFADEHALLLARSEAVSSAQRAVLVPGLTKRELVETRLEAAAVAHDAVTLESKLVGGAGYVSHSPTARRLREAAFLPIQSPTEGHLRWQLAASA